MHDIAFIADEFSIGNGLKFIYDYLSSQYKIIKITDINQIKKISSKLVITNIPGIIGQLEKSRAFFISTENNLNILKSSRRILLHNLKNAEEVFVYSRYAKDYLERQLRIKCSVQYPYIPKQDKSNSDVILYKNIPPSIIDHFNKNHALSEFNGYNSLKQSKIFLYRPNYQESYNIYMPWAAAHGVPCIVEDCGCIKEYAHSCDIILGKSNSVKQWINAIKEVIKNTNSNKVYELSSRFGNLIEMNHKIKRALNEKAVKTQPPMPITTAMMNNIRETKKNKEKTKVLKKVGKRQNVIKKTPRSETLKGKISRVQKKETPSWFTNDIKPDISIIIPLYKSRKVILDQINSWDFEDDGLKKEIIYINNADPSGSVDVVVPAWEKLRHKKTKPSCKIIDCSTNIGYGPACNVGARQATGDCIIFLNADCVLSENWVRPMYDLLLSDPKIGIVGNMQLRKDGFIDSLGSEMSWKSGHFEHVGRNVWEGKPLKGYLTLQDIPPDIRKKPLPREMVTGCCFLMKKKVFFEVEGFDERYKLGYWEDTDLNMKVKHAGYKIMLEPRSRIIHLGGHSGLNGHPFKKGNKELFYNKWVKNGKIDKFVKDKRESPPLYVPPKRRINGKVVGCVIACNEEEFLEASVDSIASIADEYIIVVGGNKYAVMSDMCYKNGVPKDNTLDIAHELKKKYDVTVIEPPGRPWKDKVEMRNAYAKHLRSDDWMFVLDADEVYSEDQIEDITNLMQTFDAFVMQYYLFWNNVNTLGTGAWENDYPQERIVKWRDGYHYRQPNHLFVSSADGTEVRKKVRTFNGGEKMFYHYAYVRPLHKIRQKIDYYIHQLREEWKQKDAILEKYVDDVFLKWREDPAAVKKTHPRGGVSGTAYFTGIHPKGVSKLIEEGKLDF